MSPAVSFSIHHNDEMSIKGTKSFFCSFLFLFLSFLGFWKLMRALKMLFLEYHSCYQLIYGQNFNKRRKHTHTHTHALSSSPTRWPLNRNINRSLSRFWLMLIANLLFPQRNPGNQRREHRPLSSLLLKLIREEILLQQTGSGHLHM